MSQSFNEILAGLESVDHIYKIQLFANDNTLVAEIENKPGSAGSVKVYHHLLKKWGKINAVAAKEGLEVYAEHTADAKLFPGKHPNIDRLLQVIEQQETLTAQLILRKVLLV